MGRVTVYIPDTPTLACKNPIVPDSDIARGAMDTGCRLYLAECGGAWEQYTALR